MEQTQPDPNKGYQKKVKAPARDPGQQLKAARRLDYSSPAARKWPLLAEAVQSGNAGAVKQLIEEGLNVNVLREGMTPLMLAASRGQRGIAEVLLEAGANVNERNDEGRTALHLAAFDQPGGAVVELLLQSGSAVDAKDRSGRTALQLAEEKGHRDAARLIRKHQQQQETDAREWEAFLGSPEGRPYKLQRRRESLEALSRFWWIPFPALGAVGLAAGMIAGQVVLASIAAVAAAGCVVGGLLALLTWTTTRLDGIGPLPELDIHILREKRAAGEPVGAGRRPTKRPAEGRAAAASQNRTPFTIYEQGSGAGTAGRNAASVAAGLFGRINGKAAGIAAASLVVISILGAAAVKRDLVSSWYSAKKLERMGLPATAQGFLDAAATGRDDVVDLFQRAGIPSDVQNAGGQTALAVACEKGHAALAGKLAALNASLLDRTDRRGDTPLMIAARRGHDKVVAALVQAGAKVNAVVPNRDDAASALQAAADAPDLREEHLRTIRYLLERGADVNARNAAGKSPLQFAVDRGRADAATLLLERGADVNAADRNGVFPLLSAACSGNAELVALLADRGADPGAARRDGWTPLMCAVQGGHLAAARKLLEGGAPVNARTHDGATALTSAAAAGDPGAVRVLLDHGAEPGPGYVPDSFRSLQGRAVAVNAKKSPIGGVLDRIAAAASRDGYRCSYDRAMKKQVTVAVKASWNKALRDLAAKNDLVVVVKEQEVFVIPFDPAKIRKKGT